jgi:hypothetical protein
VSLSFALLACVPGDGSPDPEDASGLSSGKADGEEFSECELAAVVVYLNGGVTVTELLDAGVHTAAAENLVAHRDGADGVAGTEDDDAFDAIEEVDQVSYVGPVAMQQLVAIVAEGCATPADPWAAARDVDLAHVVFDDALAAPERYTYPRADGFNLGGTEFWQKWSGGHSPTYSYAEGTEPGRRCMQASAIRFETIMADAPEELVALKDETNWGGSFFNWNDDYAEADWGDASGARLWAWRTGLIKWISQTARDGSCHLPTRDMVVRAAAACLATGASAAGEIQGCSVR